MHGGIDPVVVRGSLKYPTPSAKGRKRTYTFAPVHTTNMYAWTYVDLCTPDAWCREIVKTTLAVDARARFCVGWVSAWHEALGAR